MLTNLRGRSTTVFQYVLVAILVAVLSHGLAVWKDKLFVMDVLNRRLVKCNISYDPALKNAR